VLVPRLALRGTQVAMDLIRALAIATIPVLAWLGGLTVAQLVGVGLVVGSASVVFRVANSTMVPGIVPAHELTKRNSLMSASGGAAQLSGQGLGGVMVGVMGAASCMVIDTASYLISAVILWMLPRPPQPPAPPEPPEPVSFRSEISEGLAFITSEPTMRATFVLAICVNLIGSAILALAPLYVVRTLHEHAYVLGLVYASEGSGALLGAALAPKLSEAWGSARVLLWGSLPVPFALCLLPLAFSGWGAVLFGLGIFGFAGTLTIVAVVIVTHRHRAVSAEMLPRVLATTLMVSWGGAPLGALMAGGLATAFSVRFALVVIAVLGMGSPLSVWRSGEIRRRTNLEDP
jgi:MFS family permease